VTRANIVGMRIVAGFSISCSAFAYILIERLVLILVLP